MEPEPDQRADRDREAVEGGMELLRWQLVGEASLVHRIRDEGPDVFILVVLLVLAWVGAGLVIFNYVMEASSSWTIFLTLAAVGLVLSGIVPLYRRLRPDPVREVRSISGDAVFTATGVRVGEYARSWRAANYRLRSVSFDGTELVVDFGTRGAFEIPVPGRLAGDVEEMVDMLEARTAALKTEMLPDDAPRPGA